MDCPHCKDGMREVATLDESCEDGCCYTYLFQCDECKHIDTN